MELITVQDAATQLKVSPKAVYYALAEGKLTRHERFGRVLLDKSEVVTYRPRAGAERPSRRRSLTAAQGAEAATLAALTTQAALTGPIAEIWNTPEEDEAWAHLAEVGH